MPQSAMELLTTVFVTSWQRPLTTHAHLTVEMDQALSQCLVVQGPAQGQGQDLDQPLVEEI